MKDHNSSHFNLTQVGFVRNLRPKLINKIESSVVGMRQHATKAGADCLVLSEEDFENKVLKFFFKYQPFLKVSTFFKGINLF
jgi:hypothetical protein